MSRLKQRESQFLMQVATMTTNMTTGVLTSAGVSTAQWEAIENLLTTCNSAVVTADEARVAARTATSNKETSITQLRTELQSVVDKIYATSSISNTTLASLDLPPRRGRTEPAPPKTVEEVTLRALAQGSQELRWKRTGNTRSVVFVIESFLNGQWTPIGNTTTLKFVDANPALGNSTQYRIVTLNTLGRSLPSVVVSLRDSEDSNVITLAA